jgi:hypothetical protein
MTKHKYGKTQSRTYFVSEYVHLLEFGFDCEFIVADADFNHISISDNMKGSSLRYNVIYRDHFRPGRGAEILTNIFQLFPVHL